ncbi:HEPN domain-containing protein [Gracilibacillus saliphilus]|uniref:ApeA N-terminal domain 1-containing protein n=1 Tax=Gracilibacillus saliphilus TaxID=543890 RepID=UPI0013D6066D|nr:HEPN domain-containing protein [Gracilibacillus saliphilus]
MTEIKAMKQSMVNEFHIKGYWWLPSSDNKVPGNLYYEKNKIRLELLGSLKDDEGTSFFKSRLLHEDANKESILGVSDNGEEFTLIDGINVNVKLSTGFMTEVYNISSFIVGGHFSTTEKMNFSSSTFRTTYLTKWLNKQPFDEKFKLEKDTSILEESKLTYTAPKVFNLNVSSIVTEIEDAYTANFTSDLDEKVVWDFKSGIKVKPTVHKNLEWFIENNDVIKKLLNLFIGHPINYENITFYGEKEIQTNSRKKYLLFLPQKDIKIKKKISIHDFVINYKDIEDSLENIFNLWFEKQAKLQTVFNLYFSEFYKDMYLETSFLDTVQTLEIYHRKLFDSKYVEDEVYETHSNKIAEFINESIHDEELEERFINLLRYGNQYSLSKRIKEIFNNFSDETKKYLFGTGKKRKSFIKKLVDTRNYLTHYELGEKQHVIFEPEKKYYAIQRLRVIITIILFREIGLDESTILEKIKDNRRHSFAVEKSKDIF